MIPRVFLEQWKKECPWKNSQVEQDLVISRSLVAIYSDNLLREQLAFRGGTALHKLFIRPQVRYSEDIDLVQLRHEPISPVLKRIREVLSFLGQKRVVKQKLHNNVAIYHFETEIPPIETMRLKIEINTREHLNILGLQEIPFEVQNGWFSGRCAITTYPLEELLSTKYKAIYGRKKGRDLFDMYWALTHLDFDIEKLLYCCSEHYKFSGYAYPTDKQFILNMEKKLSDYEYVNNIFSVIRSDIDYNPRKAWELVKEKFGVSTG
ncbi:MAG: nucleotidyl transferase AbiEii/AbiGii toxin family protein [Prevotellaceae bacterium]|jgi:predicted nucleotidyltransferase component of viral defense system|nr:nucleotidyl transferase AbiEii/AbiGii toxin family protein [Prevotellaceae bacterium]